MNQKRYVTNCVDCGDGDAINEMTDNATEIVRRTFIHHVAWADLLELEKALGYADHPKRGLTMAGDWHVRYGKGKFNDKPCVFIVHSAIEYIFV
jgi:hypothetical protein